MVRTCGYESESAFRSQNTRWWFPSIYCEVLLHRASQVAQVKNPPVIQETQIWSLGQQDPLEKEMATHSSILAWEIPGQRSLVGYSPLGHKSWTRLSDQTTTTTMFYIACLIFSASFNKLVTWVKSSTWEIRKLRLRAVEAASPWSSRWWAAEQDSNRDLTCWKPASLITIPFLTLNKWNVLSRWMALLLENPGCPKSKGWSFFYGIDRTPSKAVHIHA